MATGSESTHIQEAFFTLTRNPARNVISRASAKTNAVYALPDTTETGKRSSHSFKSRTGTTWGNKVGRDKVRRLSLGGVRLWLNMLDLNAFVRQRRILTAETWAVKCKLSSIVRQAQDINHRQ